MSTDKSLVKAVLCISIVLASISAFSRWVVPFGLRVLPPVLGEQMLLATLSPSVALGIQLPEDLSGIPLPVTLVAHIDCLGCSSRIPESVIAAFRLRNVTHVVFSPDPEPFDKVATDNGCPKPLRSDLATADVLGAGFGPRVYRFDAAGKLVYVQTDPNQPLEEAAHEAEHY